MLEKRLAALEGGSAALALARREGLDREELRQMLEALEEEDT